MHTRPISTPWGPSQLVTNVIEGIDSVDTASHGGFHLSPLRREQLAEMFPAVKPYTGTWEWLEEDCDWAYAALCWPEEFADCDVYNAVRTARHLHSGVMPSPSYWSTDAGLRALHIHETYAARHAHMWERCGYGSGARHGGWMVMLRRGDERKAVEFYDVPLQQYYTDAQVAEFTLKE